jgi:hypothetical protein
VQLVLTEGSQTEPQYFWTLAHLLQCRDLVIRPSRSPDPLRIAQEAITETQKAWSNIWVVMDVEGSEDPSHTRRLRKAIKLLSQHTIHYVLSNPCFEYWLLLHEQDPLTTPTTGEHLNRILRHHWGSYQKALLPLDRLFPSGAWIMALERAASYTPDRVIQNNPSTGVPKLITTMMFCNFYVSDRYGTGYSEREHSVRC